jgi:hypothetical protein
MYQDLLASSDALSDHERKRVTKTKVTGSFQSRGAGGGVKLTMEELREGWAGVILGGFRAGAARTHSEQCQKHIDKVTRARRDLHVLASRDGGG